MKKTYLSNKEIRALEEKLPFKLGKGRAVYWLEHPKGKVLIIDNIPAFFEYENKLLPTLALIMETGEEFPAIYVDRGAIPYVAKGADVMRPGITQIGGDVKKGKVVVVRDSAHGQALAVGLAYLDGDAMQASKKGKMVKTLHHVGDWIWRMYRGP